MSYGDLKCTACGRPLETALERLRSLCYGCTTAVDDDFDDGILGDDNDAPICPECGSYLDDDGRCDECDDEDD